MFEVTEPRFGPDAGRVYGEALDALDRAGIRYMLGGAIALSAYAGIWRDTKDLDVFVPGEVVPGALEALEAAGFEKEVTDPCWLSKAWKGDLFVDIIHANQNGIVVVKDSWFANAGEVSVLGRRLPVIPAEELILSKIFVAFRDRWDLSDVLHIIFRQRGDLDWDRILDGAGEHWELLLAYLHLFRYVYPGHARYLPDRVLDLLGERYAQAKAAGDTGEDPRFRGTMLDHVSFAVDVEEWGLPDERATAREAARKAGEERGTG